MSIQLKRQAVKYVRDKVKSHYPKTGICQICGSVDGVDLHHYHSVTGLWERWCRLNSIVVRNEETVLEHRDQFIEQHWFELVQDCANLCHKHHERLHKIYGGKPVLTSANAQRNWVARQTEKEGRNVESVQ